MCCPIRAASLEYKNGISYTFLKGTVYKDMDKERTGQLITELRKEKGLTQKQLADALNVTDKAVSKWERGLSFPDISMLEPISEVLGISIMVRSRAKKRRSS